MKRKPSLVLREPVKLYVEKDEPKTVEPKTLKNKNIRKITSKAEKENLFVKPEENSAIKTANQAEKVSETTEKVSEKTEKMPEKSAAALNNPQVSVKSQMSPRIGQIWDYFCNKASADGEISKNFSLTRSEVMKEAGIGSTNTYRDALRKFQELGLIEIELRPGVNSGSIFTLTEKGIDEVSQYN